jgi:hypothetical protein
MIKAMWTDELVFIRERESENLAILDLEGPLGVMSFSILTFVKKVRPSDGG